MRDVPTTYGDRNLARGHRRSPAALHAGAAYRYVDMETGPSKARRNPLEGAATTAGTSESNVYPSNATVAAPHASPTRRPRTARSTRYSPCTRFKNLLGGLPRSHARPYAPPAWRLRTRHRCPRATTAMPQDAPLEQPAPSGGFTGGDANKISPFTPLEGSAPAPRAARSSCRRSLPGPRRGRRWSTSYEFEPRGSSCSPTSTTPMPRPAYPGPPGAMAKLVITGGSPPGPYGFLLSPGRPNPGNPIEGGAPRA